MSSEELRLACLELAVKNLGIYNVDIIVEAAKRFVEFVEGKYNRPPTSGSGVRDPEYKISGMVSISK